MVTMTNFSTYNEVLESNDMLALFGHCKECVIENNTTNGVDFGLGQGLHSEFFEYIEAKAATHLDDAAFEAGVELDIPYDKIEEAYYGEYESARALAEDYVDETGMLSGVPESAQCYFDYKAFGRDLAHDFLECDGHYFYANY